MLKPFFHKERAYWRIVLLCFLLATTFWVLKALNKKYENIRISYPVAFVYNPQTQIPVTEPPREIIINVNAKGWKLLRKALNLRIPPAQIDLRNRGAAKFLTSRQLRPYISTVLNGFDLNYVVTDTIYFNFERLLTRKLPLDLQFTDSTVATGYQLNSRPQLTPNSVTVSGPASLIQALPSPYPIHVPDSGIFQNYRKEVPLGFVPENLLKPNVPAVTVAFEVMPLYKKEHEIKVNIRNYDSINNPVRLQPGTVKLMYYLIKPDTVIKAANFTIEADLKRLNPEDSTVLLKVTKKPATAKTVRLSPQKVKIVQ